MKEIKFRAFVRSSSGFQVNKMRYESPYTIFEWEIEGVAMEIMQCTGIKDSKGQDVYEGDILRTDDFADRDGMPHYLHHNVVWSEEFMGWRVSDIAKTDEPYSKIQEDIPLWVYVQEVKFEVIGNIYEHTGGKLK